MSDIGINSYPMAKSLAKGILMVKLSVTHPNNVTRMSIGKILNQKRDEDCINIRVNKYEMEEICNIPKVVWDEIIGLD